MKGFNFCARRVMHVGRMSKTAVKQADAEWWTVRCRSFEVDASLGMHDGNLGKILEWQAKRAPLDQLVHRAMITAPIQWLISMNCPHL